MSFHNKKEIVLCDGSQVELENFRQKLIRLKDNIKADHSEGREALQRKMIAALLFAVFFCLFVYTNDFVSDGRFYRWLFNFTTVLVIIVMYKIAVKYYSGWAITKIQPVFNVT